MRKLKTVRNRLLKTLALLVLPFVPIDVGAQDMQWCLKTDQGQFIEMARVEMLVAVDGQSTFEVVVRQGQGAVGVKSITFELHESDYVAPADDEPIVDTATGPWCLITDQGDSIAMSRVEMLANIDGTNQFEVVTTDGANSTGVTNVRFGRGLSNSSGGFVKIDPSQPKPQDPNRYNPWCMITDQNDTIAMSRVQFLANADQTGKFEIVTTDGDNRVGISFVRFAHGDSKTAGGFKKITAGQTSQDPNRYNPWCMITDQKDTIAMSRVQMIANVDGDNRFEIVVSDGANVSGAQFVRFAHGDSKTAGGFQKITAGQEPKPQQGDGPWCLITDQNDSIAMSRVQMLANVDADGKFEIVTRDGQGAVGVRNVRFARGLNENSGGFQPYQENPEPTEPLSGPLYLFTDKGDKQPLSNVSMLANIDQQGKFEVVLRSGDNLTGVQYVTFNIGAEGTGIQQQTVVDNMLRLLTPVHSVLKLSGCGDAQTAIVYDIKGSEVASAPVVSGTTTISVTHLPAATYIVKVGSKALKFIKK